MKYVLRIAFIFASFFFQQSTAQTLSYSTLVYKTNDTIALNAVALFACNQSYCPPLLSYTLIDSTDTMHVKLYYNTGICLAGQCITTDYFDIGIVPPNTKHAVKLYLYEVSQSEPPGWDTLLRSGSIRVIPFSWATNVEHTANLNTDLKVLPNPATGKVSLVFPFDDVWNINLSDARGRIIMSQSHIRSKETTLNLTGISPGIYFITCRSREMVLNKKIIVR